MKVVRLVSELDFGGVEQVLANSVPELADKEGMDLQVIVLGKGGRVSQSLSDKGIQVVILNQNPRIPNLKLILKLSQLFKQIRPSVVHCQGGEANFHGILAGDWSGVPTIIGEEIGIPNHHSFWKYIFRWVYAKAHFVIAISEAVKNNIVALGEVEERRVKVLYNPVSVKDKGKRMKACPDPDRSGSGDEGNQDGGFTKGLKKSEDLEIPQRVGAGFRYAPNEKAGRLNDEKKPFVFVTTCRLVPIKNLDRLILAFSELINENGEMSMELWIVGDGPVNDDLIQQVKALGLGSKVKFWGFHENVMAFLEKADVFVLPSLREGSSVSLAEAMACGLPSVVTNIGGASEILGKSNSGVLVDPMDVTSIKDGMFSLLNMSDLERKEMGERAKVEAERFRPETYLKSLLEIYKG